MPQVLRPSVVQEVTSQGGEVTVRLEITLNINLASGGVTVQAEAAPVQPKFVPPKPSFVGEGLDYIIPEFSEEQSELIQFGKEER